MSALHELLVMAASAVVGLFVFKLAFGVLPDNIATRPFKQIAAFL